MSMKLAGVQEKPDERREKTKSGKKEKKKHKVGKKFQIASSGSYISKAEQPIQNQL